MIKEAIEVIYQHWFWTTFWLVLICGAYVGAHERARDQEGSVKKNKALVSVIQDCIRRLEEIENLLRTGKGEKKDA